MAGGIYNLQFGAERIMKTRGLRMANRDSEMNRDGAAERGYHSAISDRG